SVPTLRSRSPSSPPFPYTTLFRSWRRVPMISRRAFSSMAHLHPLCSVMLSRPGSALAFSSGPYRQDEGSRLHITPEPSVARRVRSEEHTSELQSRENLVCRLLLEQ